MLRRMDVRAYNRDAWDRHVIQGNRWTVPVSPELIAAARRGEWSIVLTPQKPVPRTWFPDLRGLDVLALASGGGQQGPILAAAGANITVFDNSPSQLEQDRKVAAREGLVLSTVEGDMADLTRFGAGSFDLIVHPCANVFAPAVRPVWREAFRVLRRGGALLSGFCDPVLLALDQERVEREGVLVIKHAVPYSDLTSGDDASRAAYLAKGEPLEFGHSLQDQIGGQCDAGFVIAGFYDDVFGGADPVSRMLSCFHATRAVKP